jgi:hypothetical protein
MIEMLEHVLVDRILGWRTAQGYHQKSGTRRVVRPSA